MIGLFDPCESFEPTDDFPVEPACTCCIRQLDEYACPEFTRRFKDALFGGKGVVIDATKGGDS